MFSFYAGEKMNTEKGDGGRNETRWCLFFT